VAIEEAVTTVVAIEEVVTTVEVAVDKLT
jgi:hypothetical protein